MSEHPNAANGTAAEAQSAIRTSNPTFTERAIAAGETSLFTLTLVLTVIVIPLILLMVVIINLSGTIFAATIFEILGHLLLRAYDEPGYNLRLLTSVKAGAVGGAIVAVPFNILYSFLDALVAPPVVALSTEEGMEPLLPSEDRPSSIHQTSRLLNDQLARTRRSPLTQSLYGHQQLRATSPSRATVWVAILGDVLSGPILGVLSGTIGSLVLNKTGSIVLDVPKAAAAGALGGFILGPLSALVFTTIFALGITVWLSSRPRQ